MQRETFEGENFHGLVGVAFRGRKFCGILNQSYIQLGVRGTFVGGSQTVKFVKVFSLKIFLLQSIYFNTCTALCDNTLIQPSCNTKCACVPYTMKRAVTGRYTGFGYSILVSSPEQLPTPARGGTKASRAQTKMLCHHFYSHILYIVKFGSDFQG